MNLRSRAQLVALLVLFPVLPAAAQQCETWEPGPLHHDIGPNGTNGVVYSVTPWTRPSGTWLVISGVFSSVENVPATNIAARDPNTGEWEALGSGVLGQPYVVRVFNGDLIVGGAISVAGGQAVSNIARWDGSAWHPLGSGIDGTYVRCLQIHNGALFAGGTFFNAGGVSVANIASWNGSSWSAVGTGPGGGVVGMASYNGELVAGGTLGINGGVMRWNGSSWQAMSTGLVGAVVDLQPFNGGLVAAVNTTFHGGAAAYLSTWNGSSWSSTSTFVGATLEDLDVYLNSDLMVAGQFTTGGLFKWTGASLEPVDGGIPAKVYAMTVWQNELVAGGSFTTAGGRRANRLARWNGYDWGPFGWGTAPTVYALAPFRGRMVAGGDFHQSTANGAAVHRLVTWNGNDQVALGSGADNLVRVLKSFTYGLFGTDELIAGGAFLHMDGVPANRIARRDESLIAIPPPAWEPMGPGFNDQVLAVERHDDVTYAGGTFTTSSLTTVNHIARWNETTDLWEPMGTGMNGTVFALRSFDGYLYAGGSFTTAGGNTTGGLARWNGSTWSSVGGTFTGTVYALEVHDDKLVIGGIFPGIGGSPNIAQFDGVSYSTLGTGGTNAAVNKLCSNGGRLYAAGAFTSAGGVPANYMAYWDGSGWHEPFFGLNGPAYVVASLNNEVHAGGLFTELGFSGEISPAWARYSETGIPWFVTQPSSRSAEGGSDVSFTAVPTGGFEPLTLQWYHDDVPLSDGPTEFGSTVAGANSTTLTISGIAWGDQGQYKMIATNDCGSVSTGTATLTLTGVTAVEAPGHATTIFESAGPNPTSGSSRLLFSLAHDAQVRFQVHDVRGRLVRRIDLGWLPAGRHETVWDARDNGGRQVASGHYYVGFVVDGGAKQTKVLTVLQ